MILIPMERWESTFDCFKKHYWIRMDVTRTPVTQYIESNPEEGVFYIEAQEYMRLDFEEPQWETWFRIKHGDELA